MILLLNKAIYWRKRLKSSLELNFTNSPLYGAFEKLLGPGSGEISGVLTPGTEQVVHTHRTSRLSGLGREVL